MKPLLISIIFIVLSGCSSQEEWETITFPLYSQCDKTLEILDTNFRVQSKKGGFEYNLKTQEFDSHPSFGDIPYGVGSVAVKGDMQLLNGTQKEYLLLHVESVFSDCMPNNSVLVGNKELADEIEAKFGNSIISGSVDDGQFYILLNDGHYRYE
ncbi:MAG: hypothetical protein ACMZ64_12035 [Oleiphilus sp.]